MNEIAHLMPAYGDRVSPTPTPPLQGRGWGGGYRLSLCAALMCAIPAAARKPDIPAPVCTGAVTQPLFISPMGEPFRPKADNSDPEQAWFAAADTNHDGKLTLAEMSADAARFFARLDTNHDGELLPEEVAAYEEKVAPEVRLYQPRGDRDVRRDRPADGKRRKDRPTGAVNYGGAIGAGRFAFFNIPNPVASADADINRAVDRAEFLAAAAERFRLLDPNQKKAVAMADLPRTPAQVAANAACLDVEKSKAKAR
jgi:hypothetical protein